MRFCEGVVLRSAALLFLRLSEKLGTAQYHSLGKTKALNSGGPGAEPPLKAGDVREKNREDKSVPKEKVE